jgi:peptidoglycan-N-acetylglucosamine deacetylase
MTQIKPPRWQPSAAIKASGVLHLGALAALGLGVSWEWPVGAVLGNHALLTAAGLWPRSRLLGKNQLRLTAEQVAAQAVAITIDDGPNPKITPQVLDQLEHAGAQATFFCIGKSVQQHPALAREMIARGHSIQNHSYAHKKTFSFSGLGGLRREISQAQDAIAQTVGVAPTLFRAPAGLRNPLLDPVLQELNLRLVSWTRRGFDTVTTDPAQVQARLETNLTAGDILLLHDGHCAVDTNGKAITLTVLPGLLATIQRKGLRCVSLH